MELDIMMDSRNAMHPSPFKEARTTIYHNKGLRFNLHVKAYDDDYDDKLLFADTFRLNAAIRNLTKTANSKLNLIVNGNQIKRDFCTVVKVYAIFLKIGEIDNVKERFQADAYVEAMWEDNSIEANKFDPSIHWKPEIYIENAVANTKQEISYKIQRKNGQVLVTEMRTIRSVFWERLELQDFPLDIQDISITVTSSRNKNEVKFSPNIENECAINTDEFRMQQEWNLYSRVNTSHRWIYDIWKEYYRPAYIISGTIARRPGYYLNNAYMLIFFITILGFVPFSFDVSAPHFRIQTTLLLILSSVNFRWVVTQRLPSVSYLTVLDIYAITALIFLAFLCCYHAIIGSESVVSEQKKLVDLIMLCVISGLFALFHIVYGIYFLLKYLRYKDISKEIVKEETKFNHEKTNHVNLIEKNPITTNSIKPIIKHTSSVKPTDVIIAKQNEKEIDGVKYRNLNESPSGSVTSSSLNMKHQADLNVKAKMLQKNNIKY